MIEPSDEARLLLLAEAIADGFEVDWADAEASANNPAQRETIVQLRQLARLVHTSELVPPVTDRQPLPVPQVWGPLELREEVGGGTFGTVYRAFDPRLDREVALKLLYDTSSKEPQVASAIIEEGRLLARVRHPNVVTIYGADRFDGRVGLWMEFIEGKTLKQLLIERGPFGAREAMLIGIDLCRALAAVDKAGLVHRDVKAQNVMREAGGRIVLMDFGAGGNAMVDDHQVRPGMTGTPLYMAPEILQGSAASARTEVYSVGILLFHVVTASFPVSATSLDELRVALQRRQPRQLRDLRPDLPGSFVRVVEQATSVDVDERFASAGAMERALDRALAEETRSVDAGEAGRKVEPMVGTADTSAPKRESLLERPGRPRLASVQRLAGSGSVLALAVAIGLGIAWLSARHAGSSLSQIHSIAVLPFKNLSPDSQQQYIVDGLTNELNATLGTIGALNVISCGSCPRNGDPRDARPHVARLLNVDALVEGSLMLPTIDLSNGSQRDGVTITVALIQAGTDQQLWTKTFEGGLRDILSLQRAIARAVADEISITVTAQEQARLNAAARHVDPEAYKSYLMGRSFWSKRSVSSMWDSITYFERAIKIDPNFAEPYAGLADAYILLAGDLGALSSEQGYALAMKAAQKALALDGALPDAFTSMAFAKFFLNWDFRGADGDFRKALELNPSYATAHHWYGDYLSAMNRPAEAIAEMKRAVQLDPLSDIYSRDVAWPYFFNRQYDEAIAQLQLTLRRNPRFLPARKLLARSYAQRGLFDQAIAESRQVNRERGSGRDRAELACILALAGQRDQAERILSELTNALSSEYVAPYDFALVYTALQQPQEALTWLEHAYATRDATIVNLQHDPRFDSLRSDRRFNSLLERLHF
jgi:serine/threonine protein kinase/tetratricopeptide (TPR) repeat protein